MLQAVQGKILSEWTRSLIHLKGDIALSGTKKNPGDGGLSLSGAVILD